MSRAKATDVSSPISLFPFIGVLLCTMGALLVVLIAVSPSARDVAVRQATNHRIAKSKDLDSATRSKLEKVQKYVTRLDSVRAEAERKLREDHLRLSHLESHMRRLQEKLQSLQIAAHELSALEEEHYDDREQAEREVQRLQELISDTRQAIESLNEEAKNKKRSYALVPYEGANGTTRRPIYVECCQDEVILQPEGVQITPDDLQPPLGPGNALASALRAARDRLISLYPEEGTSRDVEPYALVIVRPSGTAMYSRALRAIQSGDFDFGYELVEEDWELTYPAADPQLAVVEQQAIDQARIRQRALAAAAPRAYRHPALAASGRFEFEEGGYGSAGAEHAGHATEGFAGGGAGGGGSGNARGGGPGGATGAMASTAASGGEPGNDSRLQSGDASGAPNLGAIQSASGDNPNGTPGGPHASGGGASAQVAGASAAGTTAGAAAQTPPSDGTAISVTSGPGAEASGGPAAIPTGVDYSQTQMELAKSRGQDWALRKRSARAVPVRRAIPIVVDQNRLTIVSDEVQRNGRSSEKTILLKRHTVESVDELVSAVQDQIEDWGMAGDGLYWRPVLTLHVDATGGRRADDLARLLKNSGLELQTAATAIRPPRGHTRATTR